jgi:hypothetical protein
MDRPGKRHPANDSLAYLMNLISLAFSISCLWVIASAAKM